MSNLQIVTMFLIDSDGPVSAVIKLEIADKLRDTADFASICEVDTPIPIQPFQGLACIVTGKLLKLCFIYNIRL